MHFKFGIELFSSVLGIGGWDALVCNHNQHCLSPLEIRWLDVNNIVNFIVSCIVCYIDLLSIYITMIAPQKSCQQVLSSIVKYEKLGSFGGVNAQREYPVSFLILYPFSFLIHLRILASLSCSLYLTNSIDATKWFGSAS